VITPPDAETENRFALLDRVVSYTAATTSYLGRHRRNHPADFGRRGPGQPTPTLSRKSLKAGQLALFEVIRQREQDVKAREERQPGLMALNHLPGR
jgi:hypothetical protein